MKLIFFLISISISNLCFAQTTAKTKIDTSNYYNFFQFAGTLNHLRASDAIPIIIDEIKKAGFAYEAIQVGELVKLNDSLSIVLTIWYYDDPKFAFIYQTGHTAMKSPAERDFLKQKTKSYTQYERTLKGRGRYMSTDSLPDNFFLLKQTCYWYQYDSQGSYYPVTKEVAIDILKQDIRSYLSRLKRN